MNDNEPTPLPIRPGVALVPPQERVRLLGTAVRVQLSRQNAERLWQQVIEDMQRIGLRKGAKK